MFRDMKGLPDPDEKKDGENNEEQEAAQNDAQKDTTSATDPLLRNATDHINADTDTFNNVYSTTEQPADTNESSEYTAPDDTSNN